MLLTTLERTKQVSKGNLQWINDMIQVRETLIVDYFKILNIPDELDGKTISREDAGKQLNEFCQALVDYLTRGHFVIYPKILTIMEHVSNRRLTIARRLVPRIEDNTEQLLQFNDMYSEGLNDKNVPLIRQALTRTINKKTESLKAFGFLRAQITANLRQPNQSPTQPD